MMNTSPFDRPLTPLERAAFMDAARQRAIEARREAVDAFWNAVARHLASAWSALARAAHRPATSVRAKEQACRP
jgi:hypothetical protein